MSLTNSHVAQIETGDHEVEFRLRSPTGEYLLAAVTWEEDPSQVSVNFVLPTLKQWLLSRYDTTGKMFQSLAEVQKAMESFVHDMATQYCPGCHRPGNCSHMNTPKPVSDLTPEEQMQYVHDRITMLLDDTHLIGCDPPTREEIQAANERLMLTTLETYDGTLRAAVEAGVVVTEPRLSFMSHWNQELQCLVLDGVEGQYGCTVPHPIKRLYGVYSVEKPSDPRPGI